MRVNEIFRSLSGEGVHQGVPTTFIRLQGCNLIPHCSYCDTEYARNTWGGKEISVDDVVQEVWKLSKATWVLITGGEPLWQIEELEVLVSKLKILGYLIEVETNGSFPIPEWWKRVDCWSTDIKCPSSGVCGSSIAEWLDTRLQDQVKFVVSNLEDLKFVEGTISRYNGNGPTILVSPAANLLIDKKGSSVFEYWDKDWLKEVWEFCVKQDIRFSLQVHKTIWGNKVGV